MTTASQRLASLSYASLLLITACDIGAYSGGLAQGTDEDSGKGEACQPCEFLGGQGLCLDRELPPVKAALEDPVQGPFLENGASACTPANEVCVPCVDPLTGEDTGACELGPLVCGGGGVGSCDDPVEVIDPTSYPACAPGGRCVDKALVDAGSPGSSARLPACSQAENGVCVPEDALRYGGNYTPATCQALGPAKLEGRCLPEFVVPEDQRSILKAVPGNGVCEPTELCAPCYDPLTGEDTGACTSTACDSPATGPVGFASCVDDRGICIPPGIIQAQSPGQSLDNLDRHDCPAGNLCVPNRLAARPPVYQACEGLVFGAGTCLDVDVLVDVPLSNLFVQGGCPATEKCVPCSTLGQPTDAPGCAELHGL